MFVLAFDASCPHCSELAQDLQPILADDVGLRDLRDCEVAAARDSAFPSGAPWEPTLVWLGPHPRVWLGRRMAIKLAGILGLSRGLRAAELVNGKRSGQTGDEAPGIAPDLVSRREVMAVGSRLVAATGLLWAGSSVWRPVSAAASVGDGVEVDVLRSASEEASARRATDTSPDFRQLRDHALSRWSPDQQRWEFGRGRNPATGAEVYVTALVLTDRVGTTSIMHIRHAGGSDESFAVRETTGSDRSGLQVTDGRVEEVQPQVRSASEPCVRLCLGICNVGCTALSCPVICTIVCAATTVGTLFCAIACAGICSAVCNLGTCNRRNCESVC